MILTREQAQYAHENLSESNWHIAFSNATFSVYVALLSNGAVMVNGGPPRYYRQECYRSATAFVAEQQAAAKLLTPEQAARVVSQYAPDTSIGISALIAVRFVGPTITVFKEGCMPEKHASIARFKQAYGLEQGVA